MVLARRRDPLRNYQFRVRLAGVPAASEDFTDQLVAIGSGASPSGYVAGVTRVSGLSAAISPIEIWAGGNALHRHAHPDRCSWDPITLEQGLALDGTLADWAEAAIRFTTQGTADASNPVKRGMILDVWDPFVSGPPQGTGGETPEGLPGHPMYRYLIHNAWVSRYQSVPALDASESGVALLSVEIIHEGWHGIAVGPSAIVPDEMPGIDSNTA